VVTLIRSRNQSSLFGLLEDTPDHCKALLFEDSCNCRDFCANYQTHADHCSILALQMSIHLLHMSVVICRIGRRFSGASRAKMQRVKTPLCESGKQAQSVVVSLPAHWESGGGIAEAAHLSGSLQQPSGTASGYATGEYYKKPEKCGEIRYTGRKGNSPLGRAAKSVCPQENVAMSHYDSTSTHE
jgi:hypothetical protein